MEILNNVKNERVVSIKNGNKSRRDVMGLILAEFQKKIKENELNGSTGLEDSEAIAILMKMKKQRMESISFYERANDTRKDLEQYEINVIEEFLPVQKSREELEAIVKEFVISSGAGSFKEFGKNMKALRERLGDGVDMAVVSGIVRETLGE